MVSRRTRDEKDARYLAEALELGRTALGRAGPNPAVGCLIVAPETDEVVGRGVTAEGGRPHAEPQALQAAGNKARGATAYVTLEPCSHWGRTPPCSEALAEAGVARVVFPMLDPDPRVCGAGARSMRAQGIVVDEGLMAEAAREANLGFLTRTAHQRPAVLPTAEDVSRQAAAFARAADAAPYGPVDALLGSPDYWGQVEGLAAMSRPRRFLDPHTELCRDLEALAQEGLSRLLVAREDPLAEALQAQGVLVPPRLNGATRVGGRPKVKVCGFTQEAELEGAVQLGVDAVGIVLSDGPCRVERARAKALLECVQRLGTSVVTVAIAGRIELGYVELARELGFDLVQVVDPPVDWLAERPWALPLLFDRDGQDAKAERLAGLAATFDRFAASLGFPPVFTLDGPHGGGRGVAANWHRAARLSARWPLTLAGGLHPGNVREAIARVQPVALDLSSGVETAPGRKSVSKIRAFLEASSGQVDH